MTDRGTAVLVGAGHAHLWVARHADRFVRAGHRLVMIDPGTFWYSGLATGMLSGMYPPDQDQLDPRQLIERQGGEFVAARVTAIDTARRRLQLDNGTTLHYDALSLNIGSEIADDRLTGQDNVWTVKPISSLWRLRQRLEAQFRTGERPRLVVVGGGPTGSEIAASLDALARRFDQSPQVTLISRSERLISGNAAGAGCQLARALAGRGIELRLGQRVTDIEPDRVWIDNHPPVSFDHLILATGLKAQRLVRTLGLPFDDEAGLKVTDRLQSIGDSRVFAVGDCADIGNYQLPKLGVFGVRAAPVLGHNLLAVLQQKPLNTYRPQQRYLAILNLGDGRGLATWGPLWWQGRISLWLKDRIDRRFMNSYRQVYQSA